MADHIYTVKQVNAYIRDMFDRDFMLNRIYVKGEVSICKYHTSGHIYFSLKDECLRNVCRAAERTLFSYARGAAGDRLRDGRRV